MKLSDLKAAKYNPRKISKEAMNGLKHSIESFGNIADITYNQRTGNLVCGHQRVEALKEKYGDLEIIKVDNEVVKDSYFISSPDYYYPVYMVDWPIEKEKAANIAANSKYLAGQWTPDLGNLLGEIQADLPDLFDSLNFELLLDDVPEIEIAPPENPESPESPPRDKQVTCPECGHVFEPEKE